MAARHFSISIVSLWLRVWRIITREKYRKRKVRIRRKRKREKGKRMRNNEKRGKVNKRVERKAKRRVNT
jgi:hypothetical protein